MCEISLNTAAYDPISLKVGVMMDTSKLGCHMSVNDLDLTSRSQGYETVGMCAVSQL